MKGSLIYWLAALLLAFSCSTKAPDEVEAILSRQIVRFTEPPSRIPVPYSVDAPLLGNGQTGATLSGQPEALVFHIARNDFWRLKSAHDETFPVVLARVGITIPALEGATYEVSQSLYAATTEGRFSKGDQVILMEAYMAATQDVLVISMKSEGKEPVEGAVVLEPADSEVPFPGIRTSGTTSEGVRYITRAFEDSTVEIPTKAAAAMLAATREDGSFTLNPGKPLTILCAFSSNFKSDDCLQTAIDCLGSFSGQRQDGHRRAFTRIGREAQRDEGRACRWSPFARAGREERGDSGRACLRRLKQIRKEHEAWWKEYWEKSYVSIPDPDIERQYYVSLYGIGSCSRDPDFPPPLFGTWITQEPPWWMADYHLNYNHMAPYYALYSANRIEQADPYYGPLLEAIPRGEYYSEAVTGIKDGIMLPVGIGPLGIETTRWTEAMERNHKDWLESGNIEAGGMFWGQKSNSAYAVVNLAMQFYHTYDEEFTKKVYPFVKGVATFWENYLTLEGDRYVIYNDAIHEGTVGTMNPVTSLGLVRMVMETACDMSEFLEVDADRRDAWKDRCDRLSDYPLQEREGKTVFRYTECGTDWWPDNTLGLQHVYPAGQIGLASDPELRQVAWNTVDVMRRWLDFNGTNSFYPAAVRVGYPADSILTHLKEYSLHTYHNGFQKDNPHGTETWSTVPNTINEMLCMGHQGVVRLFPCWPRSLDASFHQIRVEGAFLVSASIKDGVVGDVTIVSEKGRPLTLLDPWNGEYVHLETVPGGVYSFTAKE